MKKFTPTIIAVGLLSVTLIGCTTITNPDKSKIVKYTGPAEFSFNTESYLCSEFAFDAPQCLQNSNNTVEIQTPKLVLNPEYISEELAYYLQDNSINPGCIDENTLKGDLYEFKQKDIQDYFNNNFTAEISFEIDTLQVERGNSACLSTISNIIYIKKVETNSSSYTSEDYGFTLQFPDTWKNYLTSKRVLELGETGTSNSIDFGLIEQESIFNISIYTNSQWAEIQKDEGPKPTLITSNDELTFSYSTAQDASNENILTRMQEVKGIIATFKLSPQQD
jgi:hypothetical protein